MRSNQEPAGTLVGSAGSSRPCGLCGVLHPASCASCVVSCGCCCRLLAANCWLHARRAPLSLGLRLAPPALLSTEYKGVLLLDSRSRWVGLIARGSEREQQALPRTNLAVPRRSDAWPDPQTFMPRAYPHQKRGLVGSSQCH
jgi:hypothetical protein